MDEVDDREIVIASLAAQVKDLRQRNDALMTRIFVAEGLQFIASAEKKPCKCPDCQVARNCVIAFGFEDSWWTKWKSAELSQFVAEFSHSEADFRARHGIE
tara:strand:+ start:24886 stop:25188 length:303 start_codon:yes stop_codon:yes gene_type:complete